MKHDINNLKEYIRSLRKLIRVYDCEVTMTVVFTVAIIAGILLGGS